MEYIVLLIACIISFICGFYVREGTVIEQELVILDTKLTTDKPPLPPPTRGVYKGHKTAIFYFKNHKGEKTLVDLIENSTLEGVLKHAREIDYSISKIKKGRQLYVNVDGDEWIID